MRGHFFVALAASFFQLGPAALAAPVTERVDVRASGWAPPFGGSANSISANGRFVAFELFATLPPDDTSVGGGTRDDIFVPRPRPGDDEARQPRTGRQSR
jgi:hypothetical protein